MLVVFVGHNATGPMTILMSNILVLLIISGHIISGWWL